MSQWWRCTRSCPTGMMMERIRPRNPSLSPPPYLAIKKPMIPNGMESWLKARPLRKRTTVMMNLPIPETFCPLDPPGTTWKTPKSRQSGVALLDSPKRGQRGSSLPRDPERPSFRSEQRDRVAPLGISHGIGISGGEDVCRIGLPFKEQKQRNRPLSPPPPVRIPTRNGRHPQPAQRSWGPGAFERSLRPLGPR